MGTLNRFKRMEGGFRRLVELLESTAPAKRQRMIEIAREEDSAYTQRALESMITLEDFLALSDSELAKVIAHISVPRMIAYAISGLSPDLRQKFLRNSRPDVAEETALYLDAPISAGDRQGAELKLIVIARELERKRVINLKRIAEN